MGSVLAAAGLCAVCLAMPGQASDESYFEVTNETRLCIPKAAADGVVRLDSRTVVFVTPEGYFLNRLQGRCELPEFDGFRVGLYTRGAMLCRNDKLELFEPLEQRAAFACALGEFQVLASGG
jgi:hypothetical protein